MNPYNNIIANLDRLITEIDKSKFKLQDCMTATKYLIMKDRSKQKPKISHPNKCEVTFHFKSKKEAKSFFKKLV